jgi:hypothetical protein
VVPAAQNKPAESLGLPAGLSFTYRFRSADAAGRAQYMSPVCAASQQGSGELAEVPTL